jgi:probable F420-dependent oxidoreductase
MQYGTHLFATEHSIQPGELALASEERGFESVWFSEHTHIPVKFLNSSKRGPRLPDHYWQTYDPFIASTISAAATKSIKIGTGVSLINEHDTIALAKTVATVDQIYSGRFIFGVGAGWLVEEMENHGVNFRTRFRLLDEQLSAMKIIWSQAEPAYHGDFVNFSKMKAYPKPVQSPYPAIIGGGGTGPKTLEFVVNHCSGWMPILGHPDWPGIKDGIEKLHKLASQAGREASSFGLSIFCWSPPEQKIREEMQAYGVKKLVISFEGRSREEALPLLDEYAQLTI